MVITEETKNKIVELYKSGNTLNKISFQLNLNVKTVKKYLDLSGTKRRNLEESRILRYGDLSSTEDKILTLYEQNYSIAKISKNINKSAKFVSSVLKRKNIKRKSFVDSCKKYTLNENAFNILTEDAAYWLGFLMADGCVSLAHSNERKSDRVILGLQEKDKEHLFKYKLFLGSSHPVKITKNNLYLVEFRSNNISSILQYYGIVPKKSLIATPKNNINLNKNFWRGVVDGDGHISNRKENSKQLLLSITGSENIIKSFVAYVETTLNIKKHYIYVEDSGHTFRVTYTGNRARKICEHLYKDSSIFLPRKKEIVEKVLLKYNIQI